MKILKRDIGRWVTVKWDDIGRKDCLLIEVDKQTQSGKVFEPFDGTNTISLNQIIEKRKYLTAE